VLPQSCAQGFFESMSGFAPLRKDVHAALRTTARRTADAVDSQGEPQGLRRVIWEPVTYLHATTAAVDVAEALASPARQPFYGAENVLAKCLQIGMFLRRVPDRYQVAGSPKPCFQPASTVIFPCQATSDAVARRDEIARTIPACTHRPKQGGHSTIAWNAEPTTRAWQPVGCTNSIVRRAAVLEVDRWERGSVGGPVFGGGLCSCRSSASSFAGCSC
jgi:hypothetical protein